jgi:hypothetical protein
METKRPSWVWAAGAIFAWAICLFPLSSCRSDCLTKTVGIDTTGSRLFIGAFSGRSVAQVFNAPDTLVQSVTVWRPASDVENYTGMHLFITGVDSTGVPDPSNVLLDGETIVLPLTGPTSKPVIYSLDPPLPLPHKGLYAFAIKQENPSCLGVFSLMADSTNAYPDGDAWIIHPFFSCLGLGRGASPQPADVVFEVSFCEMPVPVVRTTWGYVKAFER